MAITLEELAENYRPHPFSTEGEAMHQFTTDLSRARLSTGERAIRKALERLFRVKNTDLMRSRNILCWSDITSGLEYRNYQWVFSRVWFIGTMYQFDLKGDDIVSHFFVREFRNHNAPLDSWNDDLIFPYGVRQYSVACILPEGYQLPVGARKDYQNQSVAVIPWDKTQNFGVDMTKILPIMGREV